MTDFSLLPGLPPYGGLARSFPPEWSRFGREGVVVQFIRADGSAWVGNFSPGLGGVTDVRAHPDGRRVIVVARGDVWIVDADAETAERVAVAVEAIWPVEEPAGIVMSRQVAFIRLGAKGIVWRTRRLSWDGFSEVRLKGAQLTGLAWNPMGNTWKPFEVNLATGASTGGSFDLPDSEGWEKLAS